jgi:hypothetical protein
LDDADQRVLALAHAIGRGQAVPSAEVLQRTSQPSMTQPNARHA